MINNLLKEYFGIDLYIDVKKYYVSKIINLMIKNKNLIIKELTNSKEYYMDWLKYFQIYKDIENNQVDITLKKYHFSLCEVVMFENAKDMYKYIVKMIKKGLENEKDI